MATYAIGDLQGCLQEFEALLSKVGFGKDDRLWLVGDLVNRGPDSLGVLRRVYELREQCHIVLGNHDLHLLAIVYGGHSAGRSDTFDELLRASDLEVLVEWLRQQKLVYTDPGLGCTMVHAGIPHIWSLDTAHQLAAEVETIISGRGSMRYQHFFAELYGNKPACWEPTLRGMDRYRLITNYLTRMRLIKPSGELDFSHKGALGDAPNGWSAWYTFLTERWSGHRLLFGHWAALDGATGLSEVLALDTGAVWGRKLTALHLESGERIAVQATE